MNEIRSINNDDFNGLSNIGDKIKFLLRYAILAPSTHNSQPWLFKVTENSCKVYYDPKLKILHADPISRDMYISIGCAIENFIIAAKYFGMYEDINYIFDEENLIAEIILKNPENVNKKYENLLTIIKRRINARGVFSGPVDNNIISEMNAIIEEYSNDNLKVDFIKDEKNIEELASLTARGIEIAYKSSDFRREMSSWMHNSLSKKKDGLPGYALKMPFLLSFIIPTLVRFFNIGGRLASLNYKSLSSAPVVCVVSSKDNNKLTWTKVGRLAEKLMLEFNDKGLNTSIFVASIEMGDLHKRVQRIINTDLTPQFLFVVGKIDSLHKYTPRHDLDDKMIVHD